MLILGEWFHCDDDVLRPVLRIDVMSGNNRWIHAPFLVDTGADRTGISGALARVLGLEPANGDGAELAGVGGHVESVIVQTQLRLTTHDGGNVLCRGHYAAITRVDALDISVLGNDVLRLFAVIVDWPGGAVCLVSQRHQYQIVPA